LAPHPANRRHRSEAPRRFGSIAKYFSRRFTPCD
jgi:hypothetical protein